MEVDHVMNALVSVCSVVVILRVGDASSVFRTIMVILRKLIASVSFKNRDFMDAIPLCDVIKVYIFMSDTTITHNSKYYKYYM